MDLIYFLEERIRFAVYFYENGSRPFQEIKNSIEAEEPPYIQSYNESGEPEFLQEWQDAETGIQSVGVTALSMLSSSLQLFLNEWVCRIETNENKFSRTHKKKGWFFAYRKIMEEIGLTVAECPADLQLIEQGVLARNRGQHPDALTILRTTHSKSDLNKHPSPYFVSEADRRIIEENGGDASWWLMPNLYADSEKLSVLSSEILKFSQWLEDEYWNAVRA